MLYAALGDSITFGYVASPEKRFTTRIQSTLAKRQRVSMFVHARPGWTSKQLLRSLKKVPTAIWDEASVITILIGGNDLLRHVPWLLGGDTGRSIKVADRLRENLTEIIRTVRRPHTKILVSTIYNPFPNYLLAAECTTIINKSIRLAVHRENGILVDTHAVFLGKEHRFVEGYRGGELRDFKLRGNPIHPNDAGHEAIARAFLHAYRNATTRRVQPARRIVASTPRSQ